MCVCVCVCVCVCACVRDLFVCVCMTLCVVSSLYRSLVGLDFWLSNMNDSLVPIIAQKLTRMIYLHIVINTHHYYLCWIR